MFGCSVPSFILNRKTRVEFSNLGYSCKMKARRSVSFTVFKFTCQGTDWDVLRCINTLNLCSGFKTLVLNARSSSNSFLSSSFSMVAVPGKVSKNTKIHGYKLKSESHLPVGGALATIVQLENTRS